MTTTTVSETVTLRAEHSGNGSILSLPPDILDLLGMEEGTILRAVSTPDGILLRAVVAQDGTADADFAEAMAAFDRVSARYKNALRELAK